MKTIRELFEPWIAALRTDEFTQCTSRLGIDGTNRRCCLGVYADVHGIPVDYSHGTLIYDIENENVPDVALQVKHKGNFSALIREVTNGRVDPETLPGSSLMYLNGAFFDGASLNDALGLTFPEIADIYERALNDPENFTIYDER